MEEGTLEASRVLLDKFLETSDPLLASLIEEALLSFEITSTLVEAFGLSDDPVEMERIAGLLVKGGETRPAIQDTIVDLFLNSLCDQSADEERLRVAREGLVLMGLGALDRVGTLMSDPDANPEIVQAAARIMASLGAEHSQEVRDRLKTTLASDLEAIQKPNLTAKEVETIRANTQSLVWAAANRPDSEHDELGGLLLQELWGASDKNQVQSLAWGLANLHGLSDTVRLSTVASILDAVSTQGDADIRQSYVWTVGHLATFYGERPVDQVFFQIKELAESRLRLDMAPEVWRNYEWLLHLLTTYERKQ